MSRKKRRRKYKPYKQVKMKFFGMSDPFGDMPLEQRRQILIEAAAKARVEFQSEFPKLRGWFDEFDPLYVLSFCVMYFLSAPAGVDKEAVDGKIDFGSHHLELLQAIALMGPRLGTPKPLLERATELQQSLRRLTQALSFGDVNSTLDTPEEEIKKKVVLSQMRGQTLAIRNWAFPEQTTKHLKALLSGKLDARVAATCGGVKATRLIDAVIGLQHLVNDRLNAHLDKLRPMALARDFDGVCAAYAQSFPEVMDDRAGMRRVFDTMCRGDLRNLKAMLMTHADLRLHDIFTLTMDDIAQAYGTIADRHALAGVFDAWAISFGDLKDANPAHFLYSNPVLSQPFIRLGTGTYFWALGGIATHTLPAMLERLIDPADRERYLQVRSKYLEDTVADLCRKAFPDGQVFAGSKWRQTPTDNTIYENDVLVLIDTTAIVLEAKAHLVDPPARRGAEFRFADTLEDLIVEASVQAQRFADFLQASPTVHRFTTKAGGANVVDVSNTLRFIPMSVTYENLGYISANLKQCVKAGLIKNQALVPSICFTDLEVVFELLDSQAQRIHYLARRAEIERTMEYFGDELDLLAFYLESGFNIGEWEYGSHYINLNMKSKELDPFFVARADGVSVPKPRLDLSEWWTDILARVEARKLPAWTEVAYIFLNIGRREQDRFRRGFEKTAKQVAGSVAKQKHNWVIVRNDTTRRPYAVIGFPFLVESREERNRMISHMAGELEDEAPALGIAVVGVDVRLGGYPYDVLAYLPGHAKGAPNASRMKLEKI